MNKLLLPFDGSENAARALRYAARLARERAPVQLHLVHAHEAPLIYGEIAVYVPVQKMTELQRRHSQGVLDAGEAVLRAENVDFTSEILTGPVAAAIARRADELGCDGIVMGTRGLTPVGSLVMGSVAQKILHFANVPVTLVK